LLDPGAAAFFDATLRKREEGGMIISDRMTNIDIWSIQQTGA
jgi:hypothetical protein